MSFLSLLPDSAFLFIVNDINKNPYQMIGKNGWVIEGARTPDPQNHNLML